MSVLLGIEGVRRSFYGDEVLRGVTFDVAEGSFTGLIGPNGAGKSTLLKTVAGFLPVQDGATDSADRPITRTSPLERVRAGIAFVPQDRNVFAPLSVNAAGGVLGRKIEVYRRTTRPTSGHPARTASEGPNPMKEPVMNTPLEKLTACLEAPGQPETLYRALEAETQRLIGHGLFTLLYLDGQEVARVYSSNPKAYPVFGRKPMGPTPWGKHVIEGRQPYLGRDAASIRWAFFDHELIASLGLGSVINIPIIYDGTVIGTMNLLDREHHYEPAHVSLVAPLAPAVIPAFLLARLGARGDGG